MNAPQPKPKLNLGKLSAVAQLVVAKPDGTLPLALIDVERQVRSKLGDLTELAASIKAIGVQQPIIVLAKDDDRYRLIAGERRFRASLLAGLTTIPVLIRRGLTEVEIRQIQVTENNDRENLSAFDEAMGVAEDVERYGTKQAIAIWNRSEGWISKRVAVRKYADSVREVLQAGLCNDLEVLHSLNQLYAISQSEYDGLVQRLRSGVTVSRDDARNKVSSVKVWQKQADEARALRDAIHPPADESPAGGEADAGADTEADAAGDGGDALAGVAGGEAPALATPGAASESTSGADTTTTASTTANKAKPGKSGAGKPARPSDPAARAEQQAAAQRESAQIALDIQRAELMEWGDALRPHFATLQSHMATLDYDLAQGEWVLWAGFLDSVLPMLASLGKERAAGYLRRLQSELKTREPLTWWRELHPGENDDSDAESREAIAPMPEGWRF